ncbi:Casein kinase 1-like protein 5 [Lamellibrachia satsuma]|nr:Casein kinase 1-like protein 5 [Lamellibrachia satsuma]
MTAAASVSNGQVPTAEEPAPQSDFIIGRSIKTRVLEEINRGAFGRIHRGVLLETNEEVVVKLETLKHHRRDEVLLAEGNIFRNLEGGPGIPKIYWFGVYEPHYNGLVMEYLGPSLQDLFAYCHRKFSLKTILMLFDQIINIFQHVHDRGYVYRDVKPDNFLIGRGSNSHQVYIVDFGLAKKLQTLALRHTPTRSVSPLHGTVGTPRYASIRAHVRTDIGPTDDLEAFAYVCVYFFKGSLPWQGLSIEGREEKRLQIKQMKLDMSACDGMPKEFSTYLQYARSALPTARPDHEHLKYMFRQLAETLDIVYDFRFDWVKQKEEIGEEYMSRGLTDQGHNSLSPTW